MVTLMSNTSAIPIAGVTLASFLSVSVWAFPAAADPKAPSGVIYTAAECQPGYHRGPDGQCHCFRGYHFSSRAGQCLRNCGLPGHAGLKIC
jgi:hypothetical protein